MLVFLLANFEFVLQVSNTIVTFLIRAAYHPYELTLIASEYYGWTLVLVLK